MRFFLPKLACFALLALLALPCLLTGEKEGLLFFELGVLPGAKGMAAQPRQACKVRAQRRRPAPHLQRRVCATL